MEEMEMKRPGLFHVIVHNRLVARVMDEKGVGILTARRMVAKAGIDDRAIDAQADMVGAPAGVAAVDWPSVFEFIKKIIEMLLPLILAM